MTLHLAVRGEGHEQVAGPPKGSGTSASPTGPGDQRTAVPSHFHPSTHWFISGHPSSGHCKRLSLKLLQTGPGSEREVITNECSDLTMCPGASAHCWCWFRQKDTTRELPPAPSDLVPKGTEGYIHLW